MDILHTTHGSVTHCTWLGESRQCDSPNHVHDGFVCLTQVGSDEFSANHPGGPLVFEVGYHPRKKIHVIGVVFQDQAMYARTSFRGAKTCKIGKKGMFLVI